MKQHLVKLARGARSTLFAASRASGAANWLADSDWRRAQLLILCYHGVSIRDEHEWDPELFVTPAFLRRRFEILRDEKYAVLPLGEAVDRLASGKLPRRAVVLTFDDGMYNFHSVALPILEEFGFPATVYLSSYHCLHQRPLMYLSLHYMLWRARHRTLAPDTLPGQATPVDLGNADERTRLAGELANLARAFASDRNAQMTWVGDVARRLGVDWNDFLKSRMFHLMTSSEVKDVAQRGADVQLHTHRHRTPRDEALFRFEIQENKKIIEALTGKTATHFCYPSGDHDPLFLPLLAEMGVTTATTCETGLATRRDNPLLLPRFIDTMPQTELTFESWLAGTAALARTNRG